MTIDTELMMQETSRLQMWYDRRTMLNSLAQSYAMKREYHKADTLKCIRRMIDKAIDEKVKELERMNLRAAAVDNSPNC